MFFKKALVLAIVVLLLGVMVVPSYAQGGDRSQLLQEVIDAIESAENYDSYRMTCVYTNQIYTDGGFFMDVNNRSTMQYAVAQSGSNGEVSVETRSRFTFGTSAPSTTDLDFTLRWVNGTGYANVARYDDNTPEDNVSFSLGQWVGFNDARDDIFWFHNSALQGLLSAGVEEVLPGFAYITNFSDLNTMTVSVTVREVNGFRQYTLLMGDTSDIPTATGALLGPISEQSSFAAGEPGETLSRVHRIVIAVDAAGQLVHVTVGRETNTDAGDGNTDKSQFYAFCNFTDINSPISAFSAP